MEKKKVIKKKGELDGTNLTNFYCVKGKKKRRENNREIRIKYMKKKNVHYF